MPSTLRQPTATAQDKSLVIGRPEMAKAALSDNRGQDRLSGVVIEAARKVYGKQEAAAAHLGKDAGNFSRDVKAGRLPIAQLDELGGEFLAVLGQELVEQFGTLSSPKARAQQTIREMRQKLDELQQFVEVA